METMIIDGTEQRTTRPLRLYVGAGFGAWRFVRRLARNGAIGGWTITKALGGWIDDEGKLHDEAAHVITLTYASVAERDNLIFNAALQAGRTGEQSVMAEYNDEVHFRDAIKVMS